jgi:predicted cupin superfamily sugar epimerase
MGEQTPGMRLSKHQQAVAIAKKLELEPIPSEGGYFKLKFRSPDKIESPARLGGGLRNVMSVIYFMVYRDFNAMHRMRTNEIWCYHGGGTIKLYGLSDDGILSTHKLGHVLDDEQNVSQVVMEAGTWIFAELEQEDDYCLLTCVVTPAFEFSDYEFADRDQMIARHPQHEHLFRKFIRVKPDSTETDLDYSSPPIRT